jgi:hypothetical protein
MPYINCKIVTSIDHSTNRRVPVEMCYLRSSVMPDIELHEFCIDCTQWAEQIPPEAEFVECSGCRTLLLIITLKKCPLCGAQVFKEDIGL